MPEEPTVPDGATSPPPTPRSIDPDLAPGGVDALPDSTPGANNEDVIGRDPDPDQNPALDDVTPDEITELDTEKDQAPSSGTSGHGDTPSEPPA